MSEILINTSTHAYRIHTGRHLRNQIEKFLPKSYTSVFIITDDNIGRLYLDDIRKNFSVQTRIHHAIIPAGEQSKCINTYYQLQTDAIKCGLDRESLIIALGGGVVGDVAGFVASTFMRGIDYIQMPTTILAHDSSVGGKVAINHELGKNLIGSFYPPKAVIYDVDTLQSLEKREIRSGYAELMKEALIADRQFFDKLISTALNALTNDQLAEHLQNGMKVKATIVEADEKESGIRKYLNLGHTLGHALEAELSYGTLTHGEAVAIGILFALRISEDKFPVKLPYNTLLNWLRHNNYPLQLPVVKPDMLIKRMKSDKKTTNGIVQMVVLKKIASPAVLDIRDEELEAYLEDFIGELMVE